MPKGKQQKQQAQVSVDDNDEIEKKLTKFDLTHNYGPCKGITRLERYERAVRFNLSPPEEIKALITNDELNICKLDKLFL
jgi:hypothetical protein